MKLLKSEMSIYEITAKGMPSKPKLAIKTTAVINTIKRHLLSCQVKFLNLNANNFNSEISKNPKMGVSANKLQKTLAFCLGKYSG